MNELNTLSTSSTDTQPNLAITEVGINGLDTVDENTFFDIGHRLVQAEHGLQWAKGDWYNAIPWGDKEKACNEVGLKYQATAQLGYIASKYQISARAEKLSFAHHKVLVHEDISKGKRTELLKMALDGTPNKKGVPTKWSSKRLKDERDKLLGIVPPEPVDGFEAKVDALTEAVVSVLPKTAGRVAVNKTKKGVQKLAGDLHHEFNKAVDKQVDESVKIMRDNLKAAKEKAEKEFKRTIEMQAGVKAFMSKDEFALIRSCLHPDKNSNPKAAEAFKIFNRLADIKNWS